MKRKTMRDYARGVILVDFLVLLATTLIVYLENYRSFQIVDNIYDEGLLRITASPQLVGAGLLVTWLVFLSIFKSRDPKIVGSDFSEYRRVLNATLSVLGFLAFISLYFKVDVSRLYVSEVLLIGLVALLVSRRLGRNWLNKQRNQGNFTRRVAIYGPTSELALELQKYSSHKESEFEPVMTIEDNDLLVLKYLHSDKTRTVDLEHLPEVLAEENIEILQVVGSGPSSAQMHKKLYWALDGWDISFVVSPAITGVSSSKLTTRVIAGSPLIKISSTKFSGPQYFVKTTFDILFSLIALIIASPVMLATAIAIKVTDRGSIFFKQTRIGLNGTEFQILKFRSMKVGAEKEFDALAAKAGYEVNAVQFKLKDDPRVTSIGKFIRKTSIDELPQFINVLKGDMSVVGPRPHVHKEVNAYGEHDGRRLLVKPGITGPWQVGGRSELTWEESVSIDLSYVENWTLLNDVSLILKTILYIFKSRGAF
jgi:exopolysaccharide biosynthesis polyprenyl glycosylphosphotransferase